jgi:hypothetical protein
LNGCWLQLQLESYAQDLIGRFFARNYFSPVAKIEEALDEQRRINTQSIFPTIQPSTELPDGPILFNKNGETITCMKIGVTINCD